MNALVPERSKDTKDKLNENLQTVVVELGKLIKQSNKNSGSNEVLLKSAKSLTNTEYTLGTITSNLSQISKLLTNIDCQATLACQSAEMTPELRGKADNINHLLQQQ